MIHVGEEAVALIARNGALRDAVAAEVEIGSSPVLELRAEIAGTAVALLSPHLSPPLTAGRARTRRAEIEALGAWAQERPEPAVIVGDLNATPWSAAFRRLLSASGLHDSGEGLGLQPTWPFHNALTSVLRIPIDHALVSEEWRVVSRSVGGAADSNHRPLRVVLALVKDEG